MASPTEHADPVLSVECGNGKVGFLNENGRGFSLDVLERVGLETADAAEKTANLLPGERAYRNRIRKGSCPL